MKKSIGRENLTGRLELEIIDIFSKDISSEYTINQISKILDRAYPNINNKVNSLIKEDVLSSKTVGRSCLCKVNLTSDKAILLMSLNEIVKRDKFIESSKDAKELLKEIHSIASKFFVHTIFFHEKKLYFVLDHIFDKEAIKKRYVAVRKKKPIFLNLEEFLSMEVKNPTFLHAPHEFYTLRGRIR